MKRIIRYFSLVILVLLWGCSEKIFYKNIVEEGANKPPTYTYFILTELNIQGNKSEYLMPAQYLHLVLYDSIKNGIAEKAIWKEMYKNGGSLYRDSSDFFIFPDTIFKISPSKFRDSLSILSIDVILDKYFVNSCRLKTEELSVEEYRSVIYTLVKRKKYVFTNIYIDNYGILKQYIYYGKLIRNSDRVTENKIRKKLLALQPTNE